MLKIVLFSFLLFAISCANNSDEQKLYKLTAECMDLNISTKKNSIYNFANNNPADPTAMAIKKACDSIDFQYKNLKKFIVSSDNIDSIALMSNNFITLNEFYKIKFSKLKVSPAIMLKLNTKEQYLNLASITFSNTLLELYTAIYYPICSMTVGSFKIFSTTEVLKSKKEFVGFITYDNEDYTDRKKYNYIIKSVKRNGKVVNDVSVKIINNNRVIKVLTKSKGYYEVEMICSFYTSSDSVKIESPVTLGFKVTE